MGRLEKDREITDLDCQSVTAAADASIPQILPYKSRS